MGIFSFLNKSEVTKAANSSLMTSYATVLNGLPIMSYENGLRAIKDAYMLSDIVYSIVSKKAQAGARAPFGVYRMKSNKAVKAYKDYYNRDLNDFNFKEFLKLKAEAIEPINHQLTEKYNNPNPDMSSSELTELLLTFLDLTGNSYEYDMKQEGRKDIVGIWVMPSQSMEIISNGQFPIGVGGFQLQDGFLRKFDRSEIVHTKYANPNWSPDGRHLYGLSPISVGWNLIKGSNEGWDALQQMKENRGPRVLAGIESDAIKDYAQAKNVMDSLKSDFNERIRENRDSFSAVFGKLSVEKVGITAQDMEILATEQLTFDRICNLFKVPVEWFNTDKQSKYNNLEQFNKQAIINGVLPNLIRLRDSRNRWARQNQIIKDSEMIDFDPSVFTELEVDKKTMWEWLKDCELYTGDEKLTFMGDTPTGAPEMQERLVNRNKVTLKAVYEGKTTQTGTQENNEGGSGQDSQGEGEGNQAE